MPSLGSLNGGRSGYPSFLMHSPGKGLPTPSHPCPLPVPTPACRQGDQDTHLLKTQSKGDSMWPQTLPRLPREGLKTLPSERPGL